MIEFANFDDFYDSKYKDFNGVCKFLWNQSIRHFKNGVLHRVDGPAVEYIHDRKEWHLNGKLHREDGAALQYAGGDGSFYYKGKCYGNNYDFTVESWKQKVKELKRKEQLKIFL